MISRRTLLTATGAAAALGAIPARASGHWYKRGPVVRCPDPAVKVGHNCFPK